MLPLTVTDDLFWGFKTSLGSILAAGSFSLSEVTFASGHRCSPCAIGTQLSTRWNGRRRLPQKSVVLDADAYPGWTAMVILPRLMGTGTDCFRQFTRVLTSIDRLASTVLNSYFRIDAVRNRRKQAAGRVQPPESRRVYSLGARRREIQTATGS